MIVYNQAVGSILFATSNDSASQSECVGSIKLSRSKCSTFFSWLFFFSKLRLPYLRLNGTASFLNLFYDKFGRKISYHSNFAKIILHILCKETSFLSFPYKANSLNLRSHASQNQTHLYVLYFCQGYFAVLLKLLQCFPRIILFFICNISILSSLFLVRNCSIACHQSIRS